MEAKAIKHASKCEHACARARVCVCEYSERVRVRRPAPRRGRHQPVDREPVRVMATLPGGGPAEDGSELRSHACGAAKVETRGHAPGVGRIVVVTPREVRPRHPEASTGERGGASPAAAEDGNVGGSRRVMR